MPKLRINVGVGTAGVKAGFRRVVEMGKNMNKRLKKLPLFGQIAGAFGITSAISRITSTIIDSVSVARRFQKQMAEINTIARLSARGLSMLREQVQDLSVELGVATDTLTGGLYQALSAGVPSDNAIDFLRTATKASIAGVTSVVVAVDGLTSVLNAYKLDVSHAERVSDIFFETIRLGKTKFDQLSDSIGLVLPMANAASVSFTELGAAFATMTKQGLSTDKTATALRGIMQGLINPGEELIHVIKKIEKEQKIASFSSLDFQKRMKLIGEEIGSNKQKLAKLFPNIRAFTGFLQLIGANAKGAAADLKTVSSGAKSMARAFAEFSDTENIKLSKIEQKLERIKKWFGTNLMKGLVLVSEPFLDSDEQIKLEGKIKKAKFYLEKIKNLEKKRALSPSEILKKELYGLEVKRNAVDNLSGNPIIRAFSTPKRALANLDKKIADIKKKLKELNEEEGLGGTKKANTTLTSAADIAIQNQIKAMKQQISLQKLINSGKEKEAFIQSAVNKGKNTAGELSKNEFDAITKLAGEQFDLQQGASKIAKMPEKTDFSSIQRIGGNISKLSSFSSSGGTKETNAKLETVVANIRDINSKLKYSPPSQFNTTNNLAR